MTQLNACPGMHLSRVSSSFWGRAPGLFFFVRQSPLLQHVIDLVANLLVSLWSFIAVHRQFIVVCVTVTNARDVEFTGHKTEKILFP
jgi:hypothetical protein